MIVVVVNGYDDNADDNLDAAADDDDADVRFR